MDYQHYVNIFHCADFDHVILLLIKDSLKQNLDFEREFRWIRFITSIKKSDGIFTISQNMSKSYQTFSNPVKKIMFYIHIISYKT